MEKYWISGPRSSEIIQKICLCVKGVSNFRLFEEWMLRLRSGAGLVDRVGYPWASRKEVVSTGRGEEVIRLIIRYNYTS